MPKATFLYLKLLPLLCSYGLSPVSRVHTKHVANSSRVKLCISREDSRHCRATSFDASVDTIELYVRSVLPFYLTRAWTGDPFSVNAAEGCCNRLLVAFLKTDSKSKYTKRKFKCRSLRIIILKNGSRFPWCRKHLDSGVLQRLCYHHTSTVGWTRRVASKQTPCSYFLLQWRWCNTGLCLSCLLPEPLIAIWLASALISSSSSSTHARTCTHGGAAASLTDSIIKKNKKVIVHFIFLTKSFNRWGGKK